MQNLEVVPCCGVVSNKPLFKVSKQPLQLMIFCCVFLTINLFTVCKLHSTIQLTAARICSVLMDPAGLSAQPYRQRFPFSTSP